MILKIPDPLAVARRRIGNKGKEGRAKEREEGEKENGRKSRAPIEVCESRRLCHSTLADYPKSDFRRRTSASTPRLFYAHALQICLRRCDRLADREVRIPDTN